MIEIKYENPMATRSKNALAQSLLKLMMYKDIKDIKVSDVAARAGLSRQTFYSNFEKKEDILVYLIQGLFRRYHERLIQDTPAPEHLLMDYFMFWGDSRDFLSLLFRQDLGHMFQKYNRQFFVEDEELLDALLGGQDWQLPYMKAALAGVTYELLFMWITKDQGLTLDVLTSLTMNLLDGKIFATA